MASFNPDKLKSPYVIRITGLLLQGCNLEGE